MDKIINELWPSMRDDLGWNNALFVLSKQAFRLGLDVEDTRNQLIAMASGSDPSWSVKKITATVNSGLRHSARYRQSKEQS